MSQLIVSYSWINYFFLIIEWQARLKGQKLKAPPNYSLITMFPCHNTNIDNTLTLTFAHYSQQIVVRFDHVRSVFDRTQSQESKSEAHILCKHSLQDWQIWRVITSLSTQRPMLVFSIYYLIFVKMKNEGYRVFIIYILDHLFWDKENLIKTQYRASCYCLAHWY